VNERDLANALRENLIAGAALDVYTKEPFDDPMFKDLDNAILTPHLGASTSEAQDAVAVEAAAAVAQYLSEGMGPNAVNLAGADGDTWRKFRSHIHIAEKLGSMAAQLADGRARRISFLSAGGAPRIIALAAVKGALQASADDQVTIVNAEKLARESGVTVAHELVSEKADFADSLGVRIETEGSRIEAWGAVLADGSTKIVRLDDYRVEIDPRGTILFIRNRDMPGVIGRVATVLGAKGVNIAEMQNVRKRQGEDALTVIGVDGPVEAATLEEIGREDGVTAVSLVNL
jgi:D-3-phosphoglycerate dehydrogenase